MEKSRRNVVQVDYWYRR